MSMNRKQLRQFNKIVSIHSQLDKKMEEIGEVFLREREEVWDTTESPQIKPEEQLMAQLGLEYTEIHSELLMALEDYGWSK